MHLFVHPLRTAPLCTLLFLLVALVPPRAHAQNAPAGKPSPAQPTAPATPPPPARVMASERPDPQAEQRRMARTSFGAFMMPSWQVGAVAISGAGPLAPPSGGFVPQAGGFRYAERSGLVAAVFGYLALRGAMTVAAGAPDGVSSTSNSYRSYDYYGRPVTVTETTTTYTFNNLAERQALLDAAEDMTLAETSVTGSGFEIDVFTRDAVGSGFGNTLGYRFAVLFPLVRKRYFFLETGWTSTKMLALDADNAQGWQFLVRGFPLRAHVPVLDVLSLHVGTDLNVASFFGADDRFQTGTIDGIDYDIRETRRWPVYVGAELFLWRVQAWARATTTRPLDLDLGWELGLSMRF